MLVCPKCKAKYKKRLFKNPKLCECDTKLVNIFTIDDAKVHTLSTPYGDPEKWAKSTLPKEIELGELVLIYKSKAGRFNTFPRERFWIHDIFDDAEIRYKIDITGEYPLGRGVKRSRKFKETQNIFVTLEDEKKAAKLIKKFKHAQGLETVVLGETRDEFDSDDRPQVPCPACGKECDSDNVKCPVCKAKMY